MSTAFSTARDLESLSHSNVSNEVKPFARFELNRGNPRDRREVDIVIGQLGSQDLIVIGLNRLAGEAAAKHRLEVATPTRRAFSGHGGHALSWRSHGHSLAA